MEFRRVRFLPRGQKRQFTERLLKLRDILIDAPEEQYSHDHITFHHSCGTVACAVGHAVLHHNEFPGLPVLMDYKDRPWRLDGAQWDEADKYFGPKAWHYIFSLEAYNKPEDRVNKYDAINRIEEYITKVLGCRLIPADAPPTFREKLHQFAARFS